MPVMMFAISAPLNSVELTTYVEQNVQKRLESVNGVGEVLMYGARRREIQVAGRSGPPERLRPVDHRCRGGAARAEPRASGRPARAGRARVCRCAPLGTAQPRRRTSKISSSRRATATAIRIRDVGAVDGRGRRADVGVDAERTLGGQRRRSQAERRQHRGAGRRRQGAHGRDPADAAAEFRRPARFATTPSSSSARWTRSRSTWCSAASSRRIVVFVFLWNFRSTFIAAVAIPTSIIGAFALMAAIGFTLNQMTMLALTLMVGIVIDDAIVVLENIYRLRRGEGHVAVPGGDRRHARDRPGGHGDDAVAAGGVRAGRLHGRHRRPLHVVVRPDGGRGHRDQPDRVVHADADAGGALDQADTGRGTARTTSTKAGFYRHDRCRLHAAAGVVDGASLGDRRHRARRLRRRSCPLFRMSGVNFMPEEDESQFEIHAARCR